MHFTITVSVYYEVLVLSYLLCAVLKQTGRTSSSTNDISKLLAFHPKKMTSALIRQCENIFFHLIFSMIAPLFMVIFRHCLLPLSVFEVFKALVSLFGIMHEESLLVQGWRMIAFLHSFSLNSE